MGLCCGSKNNKDDISTNNSISFSGTHNLPDSRSNISYGFNSLDTKSETKIDNKRFTEYDEIIKIMFCNLKKTMPISKKNICESCQETIRKYYSPKYNKIVVEKVIYIRSSTRATLGEKGIFNIFNLLKETIILSEFDHPNVVKIYEFKKDRPAIIMEFCAKGSLRSILDKHFILPPL